MRQNLEGARRAFDLARIRRSILHFGVCTKLAFIKQQFMRGSISYEQVIHNLQLLYDELFSARVSVDDKNDIGLNESHSTNGKRAVNQR